MTGLSTDEKAALTSRVAVDRKATNVVVLDMREASWITDYFLICSGGSVRQVQAIADAIDEELTQAGSAPLGTEGYRDGNWILMDYGDLIVHIFSQDMREYYDLERLWANAPKVDVRPELSGIRPQQGAPVG
jgi:ribosome-associated protein